MAQRRMPPAPAQAKQRINEQIRITPVRVISEDSEQLGILPTSEALSRAREAGLDLVEVAAEAKPPVCRIMDYGKFKYQQNKRQSKTKSHQVKLKEIRVRPKTGSHRASSTDGHSSRSGNGRCSIPLACPTIRHRRGHH